MKRHALVIGCGLSGAVIARELAEQGYQVEIWERRSHIGGNMYDYIDEHGILVQKYGPHTFHTKEKSLYDYMCKYSDWTEYKLTCGAEIDEKYTPTPFNFQTIDDFFPPQKADDLKARIKRSYGSQKTATVVDVLGHTDKEISGYARFLFEKDYRPYTAKQWGIPPEEIDVSVLQRVPLRFSYDVGYFDDPYQIMPKQSFTSFFDTILSHDNIQIQLNIDAMHHLSISDDNKMILLDNMPCDIPIIYTGPIDELFCFCYGMLPYRSLRFEWKYEEIESKQNAPVVAYPQAEGYTRITEYKKLPVQSCHGTSYAIEYPLPYQAGVQQEPYYPVLTKDSQKKYNAYKELADNISNLYCCGRLADFKYYNMDQALERALSISSILLNGRS